MNGPIPRLRDRECELRRTWSELGRGSDRPRIVARCEVDLLDEPTVGGLAPMVGAEQLRDTIAEYHQMPTSTASAASRSNSQRK